MADQRRNIVIVGMLTRPIVLPYTKTVASPQV
jgi:hypothetical protein